MSIYKNLKVKSKKNDQEEFKWQAYPNFLPIFLHNDSM